MRATPKMSVKPTASRAYTALMTAPYINMSSKAARLRSVLHHPGRIDHLARGDFLRPYNGALAVVLPLHIDHVDVARSVLNFVQCVEFHAATRADVIGLLEFLDDRLGVRRLDAANRVGIDVHGVVRTCRAVDRRAIVFLDEGVPPRNRLLRDRLPQHEVGGHFRDRLAANALEEVSILAFYTSMPPIATGTFASYHCLTN